MIRKVLGKPVMTNQQVKDLFAGLDEAGQLNTLHLSLLQSPHD